MLRGMQAFSGGVTMVCRARADGTAEFLGSGFIAHSAGYVLTAAHIVDLTAKMFVAVVPDVNSFAPRTVPGTQGFEVMVAQYDAVNDVALLKLADTVTIHLPTNWVGQGLTIPAGASVGILGIPFGDRQLHVQKITSSIIAGKSVSAQGAQQLHLDANLHEGNSGGPVIAVQTNQVVGIVSGRFSPTGNTPVAQIGNFALGQDSTISFATPIEYGVALMKAEGLHV
jgi:S1-C subfamily serine protease